jgi:GNAT superfamily N-acetyltransferase
MQGDEASPTAVPPAARRLWQTLAGEPTALTASTTTIVRGSRGICPPEWTGVVRLGDAFLIEAGEAEDDAIQVLRSLGDPSDPAIVVDALRPRETRGPGQLAYLPAGRDVDAAKGAGDIAEVAINAISQWLKSIPTQDVEESAVTRMERILVLRADGRIVGAAGHVEWPAEVAHLGVLITPHARRAGVGTHLAVAATQRALEQHLCPQWRAAAWNVASRRILGVSATSRSVDSSAYASDVTLSAWGRFPTAW